MRMIGIATLLVAMCATAAPADVRLLLPKSGPVKVAFVVSENATLIDVAEPMQVFDQVQAPGKAEFQTFTVSKTRKPIKVGTMTLVPDYRARAAHCRTLLRSRSSRKNGALYGVSWPRLAALNVAALRRLVDVARGRKACRPT
jgi:hypothetical protein